MDSCGMLRIVLATWYNTDVIGVSNPSVWKLVAKVNQQSNSKVSYQFTNLAGTGVHIRRPFNTSRKFDYIVNKNVKKVRVLRVTILKNSFLPYQKPIKFPIKCP